MEVATLARPSIGAALEAAWASFQSGFSDIPNLTMTAAETLQISSASGGNIPAMIDGEPLNVGSLLQVAFVGRRGHFLTAGWHIAARHLSVTIDHEHSCQAPRLVLDDLSQLAAAGAP
jgi:hypothetical protein